MSSAPKTCILTGATGFVGHQLQTRLEREGWRVVPWTRHGRATAGRVTFRLGQEVPPQLLEGAQALVHCAYDFGPRTWPEIAAVNVAGSQKLFAAARKAGVESVVLISTLSAFAGCKSLYGKAKLEIESLAQAIGGVVLRPGLVYGEGSGGMFGRLVQQVNSARVVPILWGGRQTQYLIHESDLGDLVMGCLKGRVPRGTGPIAAAHDRGWELREILDHISQALGKRMTFVPVPWQVAWLGLKTLEMAGVPTQFRSDSLVSLIYQAPRPSFELLKSLGFQCRPFAVVPGRLGAGDQPTQ